MYPWPDPFVDVLGKNKKKYVLKQKKSHADWLNFTRIRQYPQGYADIKVIFSISDRSIREGRPIVSLVDIVPFL